MADPNVLMQRMVSGDFSAFEELYDMHHRLVDFHEKTILVDVYTPSHTEFEALYAKQRERAKNNA